MRKKRVPQRVAHGGGCRCPQCKVAYCKRDCRKAAYKAHKKECSKKAQEAASLESRLVDATSPDMIIYPRNPFDGYGMAGHNTIFFTVNQMICYKRMREILEKHGSEYLGERASTLLKIYHVNPAHKEDEGRQERNDSINAQLEALESRIECKNPSGTFLFVPLRPYFQSVSHDLTEGLLSKHWIPPNARNVIMKGLKGATLRLHKEGPPSAERSSPPEKDLEEPIAFVRGLRLQCAMTPILAMMHVTTMTELISAQNIFVFPHGLVIHSQDDGEVQGVIVKVLTLNPQGWESPWDNWKTCGGSATPMMNGKPIESTDSASFMKCVRFQACNLYPFFSETDQYPWEQQD